MSVEIRDSIHPIQDSLTVEVKHVPPYVPYKTLMNFLGDLGEVLPSRIDRSLMSKMSGGVQSQLFSALRYLKLVTESEEPSETLRQIHKASGEDRKARMRTLIEESYPFIFGPGFDVRTTTVRHLEERFRECTGASGATINRCINFFKSAARDAGIEISPHLEKRRARRARTANGIRGKSKKKNGIEVESRRVGEPRTAAERPLSSRTLQLRSGAGEITLSYNVDLFELDATDQKFVLELIERMRRYAEESNDET